ncbi:MAG: WbuC family cupin fold metalloprotein [Flammeovirgaceae bacterium]|nr:WbuC family cupin fold metalloprotein [Flammeovirgaceae bacterium]
MIKLDKILIEKVIGEAQASERKRKNYNFHTNSQDSIHRMLNAMEPGTYVAPHKHENPDKREAFIILKGKILVVEFSEDGVISNHFILDAQSENFGAEISPGTYHTLISLEKGSILYELKDGPWDPGTDKNFAPWAPLEGEKGTDLFIEKVLGKLKVNL